MKLIINQPPSRIFADVPEIVVADAEMLSPSMQSRDIARARASHDSFGTIDLDSPSAAQLSFTGFTNQHNQSGSPRFDPSPNTPLSPHASGLWSDPASPTAPATFTSISPSRLGDANNYLGNSNNSNNSRNPYRQSDQSIMSQSSGRFNSYVIFSEPLQCRPDICGDLV